MHAISFQVLSLTLFGEGIPEAHVRDDNAKRCTYMRNTVQRYVYIQERANTSVAVTMNKHIDI